MAQRGQLAGVRGSPLIRFILLAICLTATGFGLMQVTAARGKIEAQQAPERPTLSWKALPYQLRLSAPAETVEIDSGKNFQAVSLLGTLELDPENPHIALRVRWKNPPAAGERRFAKLTLEAPGQATFTHFFDAAGDIDDLVELPLSDAK